MQTANATFTCPEFLRLEHSIISDFMACTRECRMMLKTVSLN